jgi:phosphoglycolate phosphatase
VVAHGALSAPIREVLRLSPIRLVVFDCDGTLVDSQAVIVACMRQAFERQGREPPEARAVQRVVGLSLTTAVLQLMPVPDTQAAERLADGYRAAFLDRRCRPDHDEPLFPGTIELLQALEARGLLMGVATGKAMRGLRHVLARHGIERYFITLQTADLHPSKPHPAMLEAAMRETGAAPEETMLVGDTTFDVLMAKAAGAVPVGVAWGNHPEAELRAAGARHMLARFDQLLDLLPA